MDDRHFSKFEKKTSIALSKMAFYEILNYDSKKKIIYFSENQTSLLFWCKT
jgi:hypothetical protein